MPSINPFIHFNGNAEEAFHFYQSVFGGDFNVVTRFNDVQALQATLNPSEENNIMQISLPIGKHSVLMGSDVPSFMGQVNEQENRSKISIYADSEEEAKIIFEGLSVGGEVEVPFEKAGGSSFFGMLRDQYGIEWMINYIQ